MLNELQLHLENLGDPSVAAHSQRFFKTGPGEYGEGDLFRGIRVPVLRKTAKAYRRMSLANTITLLHSSYHEDRLTALFILVLKYPQGSASEKQNIFDAYLAHTLFINNWDLVDASADKIVGAHLIDKDRSVLYRLAAAPLIWERRIAIMATYHFIRQGEFSDTLKLAEAMLDDDEDLIHKAVGWMLREIGKRDLNLEERFLTSHYRKMPRTMLRYAIEKFPEERRQAYLKGGI